MPPLCCHQYRIKALLLAVSTCFASGLQANPSGAVIAAGLAMIQQNGRTLTITNTPGAIINWQSFNINRDELTRFVQQNANSQVLNRVTGVDPSQILGQLQSNGRVLLINPNGVLFGKDARVDVGGLIVSTLQLKDADFLAGKLKFNDTPGAGKIENQGSIQTASGGHVVLIAPKIENSGIIQSPEGHILLAAGKTVTLADPDKPVIQVEITNSDNTAVNLGSLIAKNISIYGGIIKNSGVIQATTAVLGENGKIRLQAKVDVENTGTLQANGSQGGDILIQAQTGSATVQGLVEAKGITATVHPVNLAKTDLAKTEAPASAGGRVEVLAPSITVEATVDTSGSNGGGVILIGGEYQGGKNPVPIQWNQNSALQRASLSLSDPYAASPSLSETPQPSSPAVPGQQTTNPSQNQPAIPGRRLPAARTVSIGANARMRSDAQADGNGGVIIAWADDSLVSHGSFSVRGGTNTGNGGLIETSGHHVALSGMRVDALATNGKIGKWLIDPTDFTIAASGGDITGADLSTNLSSADVVILSSGGAAGVDGDININDAVTWSANRLTLTAARDININAVMTANGSAALELNTATANGSDAGNSSGLVRVGIDASGNFKGRVDFDRSGAGFLFINGNGYAVINSLGTAGDVSGATLQGIMGNTSGFYALGSNLDALGTNVWNSNQGFSPGYNLSGALNGLGHTVDRLTIKRWQGNDVGMFGSIESGGLVANLGLTNLTMQAGQTAGGLAAKNSGIINNVYVTGSITSPYSLVGGLVGLNNGEIQRSYAAVAITAYGGVGGLVGGNLNLITDSYATGTVNGPYAYSGELGGLVGANYAAGISTAFGTSSTTGTIKNSYATGSVSAGSSNSYNVGGLAGSNGGLVSNSYATGAVLGANEVGGLIGQNTGDVINSHYNIDAVSLKSGHYVTIGGLYDAQYQDWYSHGLSLNIANYNATLSFDGSVYKVSSLEGLKDLLGFATSPAQNYRFQLAANIDLAGAPGYYLPILYSQLDGMGYAVSNINIAQPFKNSNLGFVGVNHGNLSNIGVVGGNVSGASNIGGLVGNNYTTVQNSYASVSVTGTSGATGAGGLVGSSGSAIRNSYATGAVSGGARVGGLVGQLTSSPGGSVENSFSTGAVAGSSLVGGLVGYRNFRTVSNSYWNKETSGKATSDGGTGLTSAQMLQQASYTGLNFVDTWTINEGVSYPTLQVPALTNIWTGLADSRYWTSAGNWSLGHVPTSSESVQIPDLGSTSFIDFTGTFGVKSLVSDEVFSLTANGSHLTLSSSGTFNNTLNLATGTRLTSNGALALNAHNIASGGRIDLGAAATLQIAGNTYTLIRNVNDLQAMNNNLSGRYALADRVDATATAGWNSGAGFAPVASGSSFTGSLNGLGNEIDGLTINRPGTDAVALVSRLDSSGQVSNVGVVNASVTGGWGVGGLVGQNNGTISNAYATGSVTGNYSVGGLVGNNAGTISNAYSTGGVMGDVDSEGVGGLVGYNEGTINKAYATGSVTGNSYVGGLVGYNDGTTSNSFYDINAVLINGANHLTEGGIYTAQFQDWLTHGRSLAIADYSSTLPLVNGYYEISSVQGMKDLLGFAGQSSYKFRLAADVDLGSAAGYFVPRFTASEFDGAGHTLSSLSVNQAFNEGVGFIGWLGAGSTLSNLGVVNGNVTGQYSVGGLVGFNAGTISNAYATGAVTGNQMVGGLVGYNEGTINKAYATGSVTGNSYVGGLVGYNDGTTSNSFYDINAVLINGANHVTEGGVYTAQFQDWLTHGRSLAIADYSSTLSLVNGYYEISSVQGMKDLLGFAGQSSYKFRLAADIDLGSAAGYFIPRFTANEFDGAGYTLSNLSVNQAFNNNIGFIGRLGAGSTLSNLGVVNGNVTGQYSVGGLVGYNDGLISKAYATGSVTGIYNVGGLVGNNNGTISNAFATGAVIGDQLVGGLVGWNNGTTSNAYATGMVTGNGSVGGLAGDNYGNVTASYWNLDTSGQASSGGGAGLTTVQMKQQASFVGWDFANTWSIAEGLAYPGFPVAVAPVAPVAPVVPVTPPVAPVVPVAPVTPPVVPVTPAVVAPGVTADTLSKVNGQLDPTPTYNSGSAGAVADAGVAGGGSSGNPALFNPASLSVASPNSAGSNVASPSQALVNTLQRSGTSNPEPLALTMAETTVGWSRVTPNEFSSSLTQILGHLTQVAPVTAFDDEKVCR